MAVRGEPNNSAGEQVVPSPVDSVGAPKYTPTSGSNHPAKDMAPGLNDHGKEMVLRGAFLVAVADGTFQDEEMELISRLSEALDMTSAHVDGVLRSMQNAG